jgi:hypothetical protein
LAIGQRKKDAKNGTAINQRITNKKKQIPRRLKNDAAESLRDSFLLRPIIERIQDWINVEETDRQIQTYQRAKIITDERPNLIYDNEICNALLDCALSFTYYVK